MNKRGFIIPLLIVIVIISLFVYFFWIRTGFISIPKSCQSNLIPDRILLETPTSFSQWTSAGAVDILRGLGACRRYNAGGACLESLNKWGDGTNFSVFACFQGYLTGENVNSFYCKGLEYSKTPISDSGVVGGVVSFKADLELNINDKTDKGYKVINSKCY